MIRRTEALFRFGAARPARNDFDQNPYQSGRSATREGRAAKCTDAPHPCRSLAPAELRLLAQADVQARAEYAAEREAEANQASDSPHCWSFGYLL